MEDTKQEDMVVEHSIEEALEMDIVKVLGGGGQYHQE